MQHMRHTQRMQRKNRKHHCGGDRNNGSSDDGDGDCSAGDCRPEGRAPAAPQRPVDCWQGECWHTPRPYATPRAVATAMGIVRLVTVGRSAARQPRPKGPRCCRAVAASLPRPAVSLPCRCRAVAVSLPCRCHVAAVLLPWQGAWRAPAVPVATRMAGRVACANGCAANARPVFFQKLTGRPRPHGRCPRGSQ